MTESYQCKTKRNKVTVSLKYEKAYVPISESVVDTLEREPTHIGDPCKLKRADPEVLGRVGEARENIRTAVREELMPEDIHLFTGKQRRAAVEWCDQEPVLGFNCGRDDPNLIKEHFAELMKLLVPEL